MRDASERMAKKKKKAPEAGRSQTIQYTMSEKVSTDASCVGHLTRVCEAKSDALL